jgi:hypothetical protein
MEKLTINQMETTKGGRFMGTTAECTECVNGTATCRIRSYFFWIKTSDNTVIGYCDW